MIQPIPNGIEMDWVAGLSSRKYDMIVKMDAEWHPVVEWGYYYKLAFGAHWRDK